MRSAKFFLASLGLVPAAFVPSLAADSQGQHAASGTTIAQAPVPATAFTWTGFYVGINAGGIQNKANETGFIPNTADTFRVCWADNCNLDRNEKSNGLLGGAQLGYNFQTGNFVFGAEADLAATSASKNRHHENGSYTWQARTGIDALGTARLRMGYTFGGALVYVTGGAALGRVRSDYQLSDSGSDYSWSRKSGWRVGYAGGAGAELAAGPKWSIKAEGLYYNFPKKQAHISAADGIPSEAHGLNDTVSGIVGRLGINYRF